MKNCEQIELGPFQIASDKVVVSDPCYELGTTWCQGVISNVKPGNWKGLVEKTDAGDWGVRNSNIIAMHGSIEDPNLTWEECPFEVGVDSGQAGIFDIGIYGKSDSVVSEPVFDAQTLNPESVKWYNSCCDITLADMGAGVIPGGVVSSSGYGDGGYTAYISKDSDGQVIAIAVEFIPEEN
jgi:hypothetical protein